MYQAIVRPSYDYCDLYRRINWPFKASTGNAFGEWNKKCATSRLRPRQARCSSTSISYTLSMQAAFRIRRTADGVRDTPAVWWFSRTGGVHFGVVTHLLLCSICRHRRRICTICLRLSVCLSFRALHPLCLLPNAVMQLALARHQIRLFANNNNLDNSMMTISTVGSLCHNWLVYYRKTALPKS